MFRPIALFAFMILALGLLTVAPQAQTVPRTPGAPRFAVDPAWPKPLPNNWLMGQVGGMFVDDQDHVWVNQRPRSTCCKPAPPILEFDTAGNLIRAWGGPGAGYDWPQQEHGITVDREGFVYIGGNGKNDGAILKFTLDGKFVAQFGRPGSPDSSDTTKFGQPADIWIDEPTHEMYVADG
jgi:hypothetical protein